MITVGSNNRRLKCTLCTSLKKCTLLSLAWTQQVSNVRHVTPVNSNTPIIRTQFIYPWVFSRFYCIYLSQAVKADDTKSMTSLESDNLERQSTISDETEGVGSTGDQGRKDLWSKLARRRREQQFHTLSHNFFRNFKYVLSDVIDLSTIHT